MSGIIETLSPANLTIAGSCIELYDVNFKNIWHIYVVEEVSIEGFNIVLGKTSNANITIANLGNETSPIYSLHAQGNIDLQKSNYLLDMHVSGDRFKQIGSANIAGSLNIASSYIEFTNTSLLEIGAYYLQGAEIYYDGMLDAKRGNLIIKYSKGVLDIKQNLRAVGLIRIISDYEINNYGQIVAKNLEVISPSFNNYGIVNVINNSIFDLKEYFDNKALGYLKAGNLYIGSSNTVKGNIANIKNEGRIEIGYGQLHALQMQMLASGFSKTDFIITNSFNDRCNKGKSFHRCSLKQENIKTYPHPAIFKVARNLDLNIDSFKTTSSKLTIAGKLIFYETSIIYEDYKLYQYGECYYGGATSNHFSGEQATSVRILSGYGQLSYINQGSVCCDRHGRLLATQLATSKSAPAIKQVFNSQVYSKAGIEGVVGDIITGQSSWSDQIISNGKDLVLYEQGQSKALAKTIAVRQAIYMRLMQSMFKMSSVTSLDIAPLAGYVLNSNRFVLNNQLSLTAGSVQYLVQHRDNLLEYSNIIALKRRSSFDDYIMFLSNEALLLQLPLLLLGDENYLTELFEEQIFMAIGNIAGLDNINLAQELFANAINPHDGEVWLAQKREEAFILGKSLNKSQIKKLQKPIIWFVEKANCLNTGYSCLIPRIYFTKNNIRGFIWNAALISDDGINLDIVGDVLLDKISGIYAGNIELNIAGNLINLGTLKGDNINIASNQDVFLGNVLSKKKLFINSNKCSTYQSRHSSRRYYFRYC